MEIVREVSCQHLRMAEDNTYLQVDMQANICRLGAQHFVHMASVDDGQGDVVYLYNTTATRASWNMSHSHTRGADALEVIVSAQVKGCTIKSDERWVNCVRRDISPVGRVPVGRL